MCGIVGFISDKPEEITIQKLLTSVDHRGPDESGYAIVPFKSKYLHIGSSRLSITGLEDGKMPLTDEDGNLLVYNGEIYELEKLKRSINLDTPTTSDTRHLFQFLKQYRPDKISNLNGMFAFAFFNILENNLLLARDRYGIKPLYYGNNERYSLFFSSEIKPLFKSSILEPEITSQSITDFLMFGGFTSERSLIENIKSVEPGSYLIYDSNGSISTKKYNNNFHKKNNEKFNTLESVLTTTLEDQLKADVPVDLLFSGGLDSSILAEITFRKLNKKVNAFTLSYEKSNMDESRNAENISNNLGIDIKKINFPVERNEDIIDGLLDVLPEPIADPSIVPTYYLSNEVSKYTKSVIVGDGADELFGGYDWYRATLIKKYVPSGSLLNLLLAISKPFGTSQNISIYEKLKHFKTGFNEHFLIDILFWQNMSELFDKDSLIEAYSAYLSDLNIVKKDNDLNNLRQLDMNNYLYTNILKKSDIASMLNGLEIRPVYLDNRISNFAMNIDLNKNVNIKHGKLNLRKYFDTKSLNNKRILKRGFSHDYDDWTQKIGTPYVLSFKNEFEFVNNYKKFIDDKNSPYLISRYTWTIFVLFKWLEKNNISIS